MNIFTSIKGMALAATMFITSNAFALDVIETQTITVGADGVLPVCFNDRFTSDDDIYIVTVSLSARNGTANPRYLRAQGNITLAGSPYIIVAKPGTYTLQFVSDASNMSGTTALYWFEGPGVFTTNRRNRSVYKFVANGSNFYFQRDENYKAVSYKSCSFNAGEHLFAEATPAFIKKYAEVNSLAEDAVEKIVIPGLTYTTDIRNAVAEPETQRVNDNIVYDVAGRKAGTADAVNSLLPGLYILNGKKLLVK